MTNRFRKNPYRYLRPGLDVARASVIGEHATTVRWRKGCPVNTIDITRFPSATCRQNYGFDHGVLQLWIMIGTLALVWGAGKSIREGKQIANKDRSYYRRSDSDFFKLIFYYILWFSTGLGLYILWLHLTGGV